MSHDWGSNRHLRWATCTTNAPFLNPKVRKFVSHATATLVGGKVYLFGQFHVEATPGSCVTFTIDHKHRSKGMIWNPIVRKGPQIMDHSATLVDDKIYLFGGLEKMGNNGLVQNLLRCFDTALVDFVPCCSYGEQPYARLGHSGDFIASAGHIVIFGGETKFNGEVVNCTTTHALDVSSRTWLTPRISGKPPSPRSHHAHCVVNDTLFVSGGRNIHGRIFQDTNLLTYNGHQSYTWSSPQWAFLPNQRVGASLSSVVGKLVLLGGKIGMNGTVANEINVLDLRQRRWFKESHSTKRGNYSVAGKKVKTIYHAAVATCDKLVVFGGSCFPFEFCRMLEEHKNP